VDALPHWKSGYGFALTLWHGSALYLLHLYIVYALGHRSGCRRFRPYELFWSGASVTSLATVLAGTLQHFSVEWLLCVFVLMVAVNFLFSLLLQEDDHSQQQQQPTNNGTATNTAPTAPAATGQTANSLLLALALLAGLVVVALRGAVSMNVDHPLVEDWVTRFEPILREPSGIFRCQAMAGLFLTLPAGLVGLFGLLFAPRRSVADLASLAVGGMAMAQFVVFVASLHWRTPEKYQPSSIATAAAITVGTLAASYFFLRARARA
jgi:hypothetical protein